MSGIRQRIENRLENLSELGLLRALCSPRGVDFSSNDYLGLAEDARLKKAAIEEVESGGTGSTGSRLLRGERDIFSDAEQDFSEWKGTEESIYFATGYQANIGILQTFLEKGDVVFSDELNHASIIDGIRLGKAEKVVYPHLDCEALDASLDSSQCEGEKFVITESLFSMDGDIAKLRTIAEICHRHGANLIVDEAHAVGIYGSKGSGLIEETGIGENVFLSVNTAGKALGVSGAFVSGSASAIEYSVNRCRSFIFSTAPMPSAAAAIKESIRIIQSEPELREKLADTCRLFAELLTARGIEMPLAATHIVPVVIGDSAEAVRIAEEIQRKGFDVRAIRPPTVAEGTSRLRISLNTKLTRSELESLADLLSEALSKRTAAR